MFEKRVELLLCRPVLRIELVNIVVRHVKRLHIPFGLDYPRFPFGDGVVQQTVTYEVDQTVWGHSRMVLRIEVWVFLDE